MLYDLFREKRCFKLICGAGNEDADEIEKLVYLYSMVGCNFFDVCAKKEVLEAAKRGLKRAKIENDRYLCISVGAESDQHFCKAQVDKEKCVGCGSCIEFCPQKAIGMWERKAEINQRRCIGCSRCISKCPKHAIELVTHKTDFKEILPPLVECGLDCIEFHILGNEGDELWERLQYINEIHKGALSISINRSILGDRDLVKLISKIIETREPYTTIIQADGVPMSGGVNDYHSTLQAVAIADMFLGAEMPVFVMTSGGTNSKTSKLAKMCEVGIQGVAVGSFARKIVSEYTKSPEFFENEEKLSKALEVASNLVKTSLLNLK